jgi:hypothetical protein
LETGLQILCEEVNPGLVVVAWVYRVKCAYQFNCRQQYHQDNTLFKYPILVGATKRNEFVPVRKIGLACDYKLVVEIPLPLALLKKNCNRFRGRAGCNE